MDQQEGSMAAISPTQPFSSRDTSYKAHLAAALGQQDSAGPRSTQAFASEDASYKAHLQVTLGEQDSPDFDESNNEAARNIPGEGAMQQSPPPPSRIWPFWPDIDEGTRLLFLPLDPGTFDLEYADVKGYESPPGKWVDLRYEGNEDESVEMLRVMAVAPSVYSAACDISIRSSSTTTPALTFQVYFNPSHDEIDLVNTNDSTLVVEGTHPRQNGTRVYSRTSKPLCPGEWEIFAPDRACTTKLLVFPRSFFQRPANAESSDLPNKKRGAPLPTAEAATKRTRGARPPFNIRALSAAPVYTIDTPKSFHPLIDLQVGRRIQLIGSRPHEEYSVERIQNISDSRSSSVWRVIVSIPSPNHQSVVAKVLKTTSSTKSAATMWLREASIHSKLNASKLPTIVQLLGLDARINSLYLEGIGAPSLADRPWRGANDRFSGTPADADRVLNDMASALTFIHGNGVTHNDIKPANILFSAVRGAVLIDFGLSSDSTQDSDTFCTAGTPWYVPPEFLQNPRTGRGLPGDVWALGVVMLYLRDRLPIPEKGKAWKIWAAASQTDPGAEAAIMSVREWIKEVQGGRTRLGSGLEDDLIRHMTSPDR